VSRPLHLTGSSAFATLTLLAASPAFAAAPQDHLVPVVNAGTSTGPGGIGSEDRVLHYDWPMLSIGTGEYEEGPTGVTVFRFGKKVHAAVDVRGGAPGTVNTDFLRLGYETPDLDAVVFAGGSWYGLEATTAVATALKDDGLRSGYWDDIALSVGAIIYDFGPRRLNEIYPDKRLAQAAARAARTGEFPLGAHGAGRMAETGDMFGCDAHSGEGGAFRQIGKIKIAAFVVVNAFGVVTDRNGRVVACNRAPGWPADLKATTLLASRADAIEKNLAAEGRKNTTTSLVVTNVRMPPAELQRLAMQVHTSMGRGIQPFQTMFDGDVLYAVSTDEVDADSVREGTGSADIATIAAETMWDAILSSVPPQPVAPVTSGPRVQLSAGTLRKYAGTYVFSPTVTVRVTTDGRALTAQSAGKYDAFAITREATALRPVSSSDFTVPARIPFVARFAAGGQLILNPGPWQQVGRKSSR
jgi:L-aminopeptidase/D-esterase-like protein